MTRPHRTVRRPFSPVGATEDALKGLTLSIPGLPPTSESQDLLVSPAATLSNLESIRLTGIPSVRATAERLWEDDRAELVCSVKNPLLKRYEHVAMALLEDAGDTLEWAAPVISKVAPTEQIFLDVQIVTRSTSTLVTRAFRRFRIECESVGFTFPKIPWTDADFQAKGLGTRSVFYVDASGANGRDFEEPEELERQVTDLYKLCVKESVLERMDADRATFGPLFVEAATIVGGDLLSRVAAANACDWIYEYPSGSVGAFVKAVARHAKVTPTDLLSRVKEEPFWGQALLQDVCSLSGFL